MPIARRCRIAVAVGADSAVLGIAADENHIPVADAAVDCDSLDDSRRTGQIDHEVLPHEAGKDTKHSPHNRNPHELVVNSEKGELENWKYSSRPDFHHGPP